MKKYCLFLTIGLLLSTNSKIFSQDTNSAKYFPLNVGNVWIYSIDTFPPPIYPYYIYKIERDTIINGHVYFQYNGYHLFIFSSQWIRYDSANGNLLAYSSNGGCSIYTDDRIIDSLPSLPGNQINCPYQAFTSRVCLNESNVTVFSNYQTHKKEFKRDGLIYGIVTYAKNFGIINSCSGEPPPCSAYYDLKGCVINGLAYGDTLLTPVNQTGYSIPEKFSLSQNYPNPFNPTTIINYQLPITNYVSLKVYNVLGNEIATLVSEKQNAGSYNYQFSTVNYQLPSGIYFYKLEAGDFVETKRMVLLK